jgi:hypothetical protein
MENTLTFPAATQKPKSVVTNQEAVIVVMHSPILIFLPLYVATTLYSIAFTQGAGNVTAYIPQWILLNLPDGLIMFTVLNIYLSLWAKHTFNQNLFWITALTIIAITIEHLQAWHIIKGRFDILDILFYELAYTISIYLSFSNDLKYFFINL